MVRHAVLLGLILVSVPQVRLAQSGAVVERIEAARRHLAAGETEAAITAFRDVLRLDRQNGPAHNALGSLLNSVGRYAEALPHAEAAVAAEPANMRYRYNRGVVRAEHGRFADAIADFDPALAAQPDLAYGWLERGAALASLGRMAEARESWARARAAQPTLIWTSWYPATGDMIEGRYAAAAEGFDRVATAEPGFTSAQLWRFIAHGRAARPITVPTVTASDWPAPIMSFLRGEMAEQGLLALAAAERGAGDARRLGEALFFIGQSELIRGRRQRAASYFRRALAVTAPRHVWRIVAENDLRAITRR